MRKLSLLAAAAMVAGGSAFAMDGGGVSISGEANFGVKFKENDGGANDPNELQFHHEFDIKFAASGTTDGGIGFGGSVTIDNTESVTGAGKGAKAAAEAQRITVSAAPTATSSAVDAIVVGAAQQAQFVTIKDGKIQAGVIGVTGGENRYKLPGTIVEGSVLIVVDGKPLVIAPTDIGATDEAWRVVTITNADNTLAPLAENAAVTASTETTTVYLVKVSAGTPKPMTAATAATFDPDAKQKVDNHGEVYISMDMHKLTIGSDLDAADKVAGGLADPGFDGIGIDDVAEGPYGESAADVRYDGDFGIASVAISYGDNKGDAEWAAGFSFNVEPVTVGAGFDSNGVMSIGMGFSQGLISMNALYSTDSDHDEDDNEEVKSGVAAENKKAGGVITNPAIGNKMDLKNQAIGVDMTYQMSEATSLVLVAAQHKKESATWYYDAETLTAAVQAARGVEAEWKKSSTTVDAFGVGFSHDLGGGATLKAGAGSVDSEATADLGITMKF